MSIKQKLTWAFAVIAGLPIVANGLVVLNLRGEARDGFLDGSSREIRQVSNAMNIFFQGINQNVEYLAAQPMVAATGSELNKYMSATPSYELGDQASKLLEFMTRLATTHPSYAYLSYGVNDGGYVGWPAGQKFVNYDPRTRPWYHSIWPTLARPCVPAPTTGLPTTPCWSAPCAPSPTSWATLAAWSTSTSRSKASPRSSSRSSWAKAATCYWWKTTATYWSTLVTPSTTSSNWRALATATPSWPSTARGWPKWS